MPMKENVFAVANMTSSWKIASYTLTWVGT